MAACMNDLTTQRAAEETVANEEITKVCELCLKESSKYKCPRCGIFYCSLSCYRGGKHAGCSEKFYKNNFMEVMKNKKGSEEDRKKMLEILQRVDAEYKPLFDEEGAEINAEEEEEDEATETLAERMAGLDLDKDTDVIWERLTEREKREFESVLHAGRLGNLVPIWKAWWEQHDQSLVKEIGIDPSPPTPPQSTPPPEKPKEPSYADEIEVDLAKMAKDLGLNDEDTTEEEISRELLTTCDCPPILKTIPKLSDLLRNKKPSECVMYNLLNVLYSYACVVRFYNGTHNDLPVQVAQNVLEVSATLSDNANYNGTEESLASALHNASKSLSTSNTFSTSVLQDVVHILLGAASDAPISYLQSALSDLHQLLGAARKQLVKKSKKSPIHGDAQDPEQSKAGPSQSKSLPPKTCFNCQKKLEFFLAWLTDNQDKPRILLLEVDAMYRSRRLLDEQHSATKSTLEKQWGGTKPPAKTKAKHTLIEELS